MTSQAIKMQVKVNNLEGLLRNANNLVVKNTSNKKSPQVRKIICKKSVKPPAPNNNRG